MWLASKSRCAALLGAQHQLREAFAHEATIAGQVAREWVLNIGKHSALERVAHLICELYWPMDTIGLVENDSFVQPSRKRGHELQHQAPLLLARLGAAS